MHSNQDRTKAKLPMHLIGIGIIIIGTFFNAKLFAADNQHIILSQSNMDEPQTVTNPDGSSVTINPDRSKIVKNADGSSIQYKPDGTQIISNPDGSTVETDPDGTVTTTTASGEKSTQKP